MNPNKLAAARLVADRRAFLRGASLGAAATFVPWLRPRSYAAGVPTRFVVFYTNHGTLPQFWFPAGGSETTFTPGELMTPFARFKDRMIILDGLAMRSNDGDPISTNAHYAGQTHTLVADNRARGEVAGNISIDQKIAQTINAGTPVTKFPTVDLFVSDYGNFPEQFLEISYAGPGKAVPMELDPRRAYSRLFPGGTTGPSGPSPAEVAALAQRRSVLDGAAAEFDMLKARLDKESATKMDAHASYLRELEKSLTLGMGGGGCAPPPKTILDPVNAGLGGKNDKVFDAQARILAASLACDLTRVATINLYAIADRLWGYGGSFGTTDSHDLFHKTDPGNGDLRGNAAAVTMTKAYHAMHSQWFANLLGYLDAIPEVDGKTLLDHTVVLWCGEIATGGHALSRLPWILVGSAGGYFRTGRYLKVANGTGHNDLFVSIANAMGVPLTTFGKASVCKGALPGLKA